MFSRKKPAESEENRMGRKSSTPTMKDVATEAGVALGTVSKVVNGLPVGREYQKKVTAAIEKLGYRVNSYAQGLKANKTYTVAFLIPNTVNPFFGGLTYYVNRTLAERGYRTLLCSTDADTQVEQALLDMAQQNKVDGIISLTYNERLELQEGTPLVTIDRHISPAIPCVTSDNFGGGQLAARRLAELGCRHLVFLGMGSPLPNEVSKRCDGFRSACTALNLPHEVMDIVDGVPDSAFWDFLDGQIQEGTLDGIFCNTDHLAERVVAFLRGRGIRVPEQVQIVGFDGMKRFSTGEYLCSTIVQPLEKLAEKSVDILLSEDWAKAPSLVCLPVEYVPGGTTRE